MTQQATPLLSKPGQTRVFVVFTILMLVPLVISCDKREQQLDTAWSSATPFASSQEALNSIFWIANLNGELVCVNGSDYYFLGAGGTNWTKKTFSPPVGAEKSYILADPASTRFIFCHGEVQGGKLGSRSPRPKVLEGKLQAKFVFCSMHPTMGIEKIYDRDLTLDSKELFGEIKRSGKELEVEKIFRQQYGPPLITPCMGGVGGYGVILGDDFYIPYTVKCDAFYGSEKEVDCDGMPGQTGLLYSAGDHSHWTKLKLFDEYTFLQGVFATRDNLYCFASIIGKLDRSAWGLWCARRPRAADSQPTPELVAPTFRFDIFGTYSAVTDGETIHLVWLDGRHVSGGQLWALRTGTPDKLNLELYYRSRKDSASAWTKEILLSKGLRYVFAPEMAVEGNNIVVVWSGYQKGYEEFCPSDIYFTTSRDGGKTWTATARATDNAKLGLVSGRPRVALHNGVIHLFYIQGKLEEHNVGAGLRLLNQSPWAIIYQHRLFPGG